MLRKYKMELSGILIGAIAGWAYWYFIGCASGQCMITSKPINSTVYGAIMGYLVFSMLKNVTVIKK